MARNIWFNKLTDKEQNNFINYLFHKGFDIDGDDIYLPELERLETLKKLFPREDEFRTDEEVIVCRTQYILGKKIPIYIIFHTEKT